MFRSLLLCLMGRLGPYATLQIEAVFARRENLAEPRPSQQLEAHSISRAHVRMFVEHRTQAAEFVV
jgi:hypothetical protein